LKWLGKNPEATKVSDEENQEAHCTSVVGNISARNGKYTKILNFRMTDGYLIITLMLSEP
jgi:hypothetical protein